MPFVLDASFTEPLSFRSSLVFCLTNGVKNVLSPAKPLTLSNQQLTNNFFLFPLDGSSGPEGGEEPTRRGHGRVQQAAGPGSGLALNWRRRRRRSRWCQERADGARHFGQPARREDPQDEDCRRTAGAAAARPSAPNQLRYCSTSFHFVP